MFRAIGALTLLSLILIGAATKARANQTFICEDGSQVTVLPGQLELMKRTDPCVARHFGGVPQPQQPAAPQPSWAPMQAPLPDRKPEVEIAGFAVPEGQEAAAPKAKKEVESDYRNVHIINASPGSAQFFEHKR
ncbi:exported protein of unknown function [Candidatus Filomicrobium marinum]|uniref:DUF4124 domain-containing protein n=2 Tax=Filomicrobium TaxID=119044 RepID=A0A0D6JG69_9HYPH|nr:MULTISPECIES: hypothetical protein [Filomicrobium]MCV0369898.1 hypothetical protein [Filomicrobium sp.]CFX53201.1 exported protein of unknown function [Candidatus Filomicrobium marinum]CPR19950.1 exported protein of unknown function [Candidatus Filomicrobium marinum]SDP07693.1 hypothetical protein SAMN04488061_2128 [Filomicrobium insigne]